jgi:putative membrane protein
VVRFVLHWALASLTLALTAYLLSGFWIRSVAVLLLGGAVVGLANAVAGMLLQRSDVRLTPVTYALFLLTINVVAFGVIAGLTPGFPVGAVWQIGLGGLLVTVVSFPLGLTRFVPEPDAA